MEAFPIANTKKIKIKELNMMTSQQTVFSVFADTFIKGKADAALAASVFHSGEISIQQVRDYLANNGIPMRKVI